MAAGIVTMNNIPVPNPLRPNIINNITPHLSYEYKEVPLESPLFSTPPVSVEFHPNDSNSLTIETDPELDQGIIAQHYGNLEKVINIISDDEEEDNASRRGSIMTIEEEEILPPSNDEDEENSSKSSEEEIASVKLVQSMILQDEQNSGNDQATINLVHSLQAEEVKNTEVEEKELSINDENFPPLPSKQ